MNAHPLDFVADAPGWEGLGVRSLIEGGSGHVAKCCSIDSLVVL